MKHFFMVLFLLNFLVCGCASVDNNIKVHYDYNTNTASENDYGEHILKGYPSTDGTILSREGYVLCHDNQKKVADWVSYHLTDEYLVKNVERTDDFRADQELPVVQRSELEDYKGSGYDRGHLAPAGDMTRNHTTMSESFLLSNMAPQIGAGFNRGIWRALETKVRKWAEEKKNLYVITGPVYEDKIGTIGENNVEIPSHFYKIVISQQEPEVDAIAFILPNEKNPTSMLPQFITTIDNIEEKTGLDFLNEMEDSIEDVVESRKAEMW